MAIQTLVRIETQFNQVIELLQVGPEFRIDSRQVAPGIGIEHGNFLETLEKYQTELEHWGVFRFETEKPLEGSQGGRPQKYVMLNREQVLFAITLSRNTEQVVRWKMALIDALSQLEQRLQEVHALPLAPAQQVKDQLPSFIEECCIADTSATIQALPLYHAYKEWCDANNVAPMSNTLFGRFVSRKYNKTRKTRGAFYHGIQLMESRKLIN